MAYKMLKIADKILNIFIYTILIIAFLFFLYALFDTLKVYLKAANNSVNILKPSDTNPAEDILNLKKINSDVCGWVSIDNTSIDYPIVQGETNSEYLSKDVYGNYALSGSIFLDYRNSNDFTDYYSIIFGHHMNGGVMFGDIKKFINKKFFDEKRTGTLYTIGGVYDLEIFAFLETDAYDNMVYNVNKANQQQQEEWIKYIKKNAKYYREIGINAQDKILALSTCSTATTNGRYLVFARIK